MNNGWISLAATLAACVAACVAFLGWRESKGEKNLERIKDLIISVMQPLVSRVTLLEQSASDADRRTQGLVDNSISRALQPVQSQVAVLEAKMDVFWRQVAMDAAKILHQPDPRRAEIDHLLDAFMEDTLTVDEELRLRKILVKIRNWEPGRDIGFPVYPGEQTAAAILLRTMHYAITPRYGNSSSAAQQQQGEPGD